MSKALRLRRASWIFWVELPGLECMNLFEGQRSKLSPEVRALGTVHDSLGQRHPGEGSLSQFYFCPSCIFCSIRTEQKRPSWNLRSVPTRSRVSKCDNHDRLCHRRSKEPVCWIYKLCSVRCLVTETGMNESRGYIRSIWEGDGKVKV